jgi:hypothetical protein
LPSASREIAWLAWSMTGITSMLSLRGVIPVTITVARGAR